MWRLAAHRYLSLRNGQRREATAFPSTVANLCFLGNYVMTQDPIPNHAVIPTERDERALTQGPIPERSVGNGKRARE